MAYLAGLAGAILMVVLVVHSGYQRIFAAVSTAGWPLVLILPYHLLPVTLDAYGWRVLLAPADDRGRARLPFLLWAALVREAVSRLLPVASVGGEVVGIRVTMLRGLSGVVVTASVIVEVLVTLVSQYIFTLIGVLLLVLLLHSGAVVFDILIALGVTFPIPFVLLAVLGRTRPFERLRRAVESMLGGRDTLMRLFGRSGSLDDALHDLTGRRARMAWATLWQFLGMFAGSFEVWLVLKLLGHPVS
ncbi:lysylphosphatidylglycerol synthase domain-containing protein, partial [Salinisphaera sp.]|uniref:lysylphosphatidylglycerol synthase domain-containing protein n=1 Tax=Salinisphaera sp. TaxID=1914330 RepID=UPI002D79C1D6